MVACGPVTHNARSARSHQLVVSLAQFTLLSALFAASGCVHHVSLEPVPSRAAPFAQRAAAWERLRPVGMGYTDVTHVRGGAMVSGGAFREREFDRVVLPGDVEVRAAEDLLPALDEGSDAANAAARAGTLRQARDGLELGGAVLAITSLVSLPLLYAATDDRRATDTGSTVLLSTAVVGGLAVVLGAVVLRPLANNARQEAFAAYRDGLDRRLGVCMGPGGLQDCAARR